MNTDIYVKVVSDTHSSDAMRRDLDTVVGMFREFASRFSRFDPQSELSLFNASENTKVSETLFNLLTRCKAYFRDTGGIFHPGILPALVAAGYNTSFSSDRSLSSSVPSQCPLPPSLDTLTLDASTRTARKPLDLKIDLGGIGKGYIVDRVADWLSERYPHFLVDAGGDIRVQGGDIVRGWEYWKIDIEHPHTKRLIPELMLVLENGAVATSGSLRRRWHTGLDTRHHLIDPRTATSAATDLASVTVIRETAEAAEIYAKTICILGTSVGLAFAEQKRIPGVFVTTTGDIRYNGFIKPYLQRR